MNTRMMIAGALAAAALAAPAAEAQSVAQSEARPQVILAPQPTPPDPAAAQQERALRARDNLVALRQGRIALTDLTPQEQQDVIDLDRLTRGEGADNRSFKQQCIDDEVRRAGGRPSRLAWEAIRLKCK